MILLLTGPFGVGKTNTANLLVERILNSVLFDPEVVGAYLRAAIPESLDDPVDFQDYPLRTTLTIEAARLLIESYHRKLVIPMTVLRRDRLEALVADFQRSDPDVVCLRLTVSREEATRRILSRSEDEGSREWRLSHLEAGLEAAADPAFGIEVVTEGRTPAQVAC
ncbi:MAG: AAA family ATPase [Chloroflexia bacterium]